MSWYNPTTWDPPGNWNGLRDNPISNAVFGKGVQQQPGVGGPAKDPSKLIHDSTTGLWYDPTSGTTYTDASGVTPVTNPNVAQQVASNVQKSNAFLSQLQNQEAERQANRAKQDQLANTFHAVLSGEAPSLAQMQSQNMAQEGGREQLAQVAGANGASAPLAQLMAARNTGQAYVGANNAGAMGRVAEHKQAADALQQLLGGMSADTERTQARTADTATNFAQLGESGQQAQQGLNATADAKRADDQTKFGMAGVKFLGSLLS